MNACALSWTASNSARKRCATTAIIGGGQTLFSAQSSKFNVALWLCNANQCASNHSKRVGYALVAPRARQLRNCLRNIIRFRILSPIHDQYSFILILCQISHQAGGIAPYSTLRKAVGKRGYGQSRAIRFASSMQIAKSYASIDRKANSTRRETWFAAIFHLPRASGAFDDIDHGASVKPAAYKVSSF